MSDKHISKLEDHLGYWLRCLSNFVHHSFAARLAEYDISVAQWVVLRTLYDQQGLTLNQAAESIGVDKSTLSRMIERLVQKGLVNRGEGENRRSVRLALSIEGEKLIPEFARLADENDAMFFHSLSVEQKEEFLSTIKQLLKVNGWNQTTRGKDRME